MLRVLVQDRFPAARVCSTPDVEQKEENQEGKRKAKRHGQI